MKEKNKGFTLIEVIITILIFSLVLIAFGSLIQTNLMLNKRSMDINTNSTKISNSILEGNITTSSVPQFEITFTNGKRIKVEGMYARNATLTDTLPDMYQYFIPTNVVPVP